jgi:Tfp pilus assembly protein PilF
MSRQYRYLLFSCIFFILLNIWSAIQPSHLNWGIHSAAFYDLPSRLFFLLLAVLILLPAVQAWLLRGVERIAGFFSRRPVIVGFLLAIGIITCLAFLFPSKLHLLGDGALLLRSVPLFKAEEGLPEGFRNQPLVYDAYKASSALLQLFMQPSTRDIYFFIDLVSAVVLLAVIVFMMRHIKRPATEKALLGGLLLFGGGAQFFFGYVENYALQYAATAAFAISGWIALQKPNPSSLADSARLVAAPTVLYILIVGLNLGSLIFLPALLFLYGYYLLILYRKSQKTRSQMYAIIAASIVAIGGGILVLFFAIGFNPMIFVQHILSGSKDFLPLFSANDPAFPYAMFSWLHLLDVTNSCLHVAPLGLAVPIIIGFAFRRELTWKDPVLLFLLLTTLCGFFFTLIVNSALGLARDWDLFSSFFVPLMVFGIYLIQVPAKFEQRKNLILVVTLFTLFHLALRIGVNASEDKHLRRMETLDSPLLLSLSSRLFYDEALANYFFDSQQYSSARKYYEDYMTISSVNPRILANLADTYRKLGERELYFDMLKRVVQQGTTNPGVYSNLGVEYVAHGDTTKAIEMNQKCVQLDSTQAQGYANLSMLYLNSGKFPEAIANAMSALRSGMNDPTLYRIMAKAYTETGDYLQAVRYFDAYLEASPGDQQIRDLRNRVAERIQRKR